MNKTMKLVSLTFATIFALTFVSAVSAQMRKAPTDASGEQFYIISSVDMQKHQIVLMRPTQLTVVATVDDNSAVIGEQGQKLAFKDLRAGQTVWAILRKDKSGTTAVVRIHEGAMTVAELHRLYLDYPAK